MKLSNLPIGAKVCEPVSGYRFLVAAHHHPGYPGTVLVMDRIVRRGCFDAKEPESDAPKVRKYGNNDYAGSNVHQWLNSTGSDWFRPSHPADLPPAPENITQAQHSYSDVPGFLSEFPQSFLDILQESEIPCVKTVDGVCQPATVPGKFFLLSADELGLRRFTGVPEGTLMPLFQDFRMRLGIKEADPADFNFPGTVSPNNTEMGWYYWLRTPHHAEPFLTAHIHFSGYISYLHAWNSDLGIRPACVVRSDTPVTAAEEYEPLYLLPTGGDKVC
jgi:hypothetical protein